MRKQNSGEAADFTIMLCSCDAYEDFWDPFFILLERYWPEAKNYPFILNTESKVYQREGWNIQCFQMFKPGQKVSYGTRIIRHLDMIKTEFVFIMLEDFFFRSRVDQSKVDYYVNAIRTHKDISCFNFSCMEQPGIASEEFEGFQELHPICHYRLNLQAAIWRVKEMRRYWKPGADPWGWETYATRKTDCTKNKFYFYQKNENVLFDYGRKPGLTWGSVRGLWCRDDVVPLFEKEGIEVDFESRGWFDELEYWNSEYAKSQNQTRFDRFKMLVMEFYLGGFRYMCKKLAFEVYRILRGWDMDYEDYMRRKYNPPDGYSSEYITVYSDKLDMNRLENEDGQKYRNNTK